MKSNLKARSTSLLIAALAIVTPAATLLAPTPTAWASETQVASSAQASWIVTGSSTSEVRQIVLAEHGAVTHELGIIKGVAALLTSHQVEEISKHQEIKKIWRDRQVEMASVPANPASETKSFGSYTNYPAQTGAAILHAFGLDGDGVTVAVVDTGYWKVNGLKKNRDREDRVLAQYDAQNDEVVSTWSKGVTNDDNGHGTHVTGVIMDSSKAFGLYRGMAPGADLVSVKAFDATGLSTYADVIRGLDWVVENKDEYDIRVLNLSFGAAPQSFYWDDPLNRAVMSAWREGIVVVTSAGNAGPDPFTIGVPGNNPYVITTGAITDNYTPYDPSDDRLTSFSSAGPTATGWIKPDLMAFGGHITAALPSDSFLGEMFPEWSVPPRFYQLSGTSQATAITTGVVALLLQLDPSLSPDDVKCKLTSSALVAVDANGDDAYNPLQQGAGLINAISAVLSDETGCGNNGLDIAADLDDDQHWGGPVRQDEDGNLFITVDGEAHFLWDGSYVPTEGVVFSTNNPWVGVENNPWVNETPGVDYNLWDGVGPSPTNNPWVNEYAWLNNNPWVNENAWISAYPEIFGTPSIVIGLPGPGAADWAAKELTTAPSLQQE